MASGAVVVLGGLEHVRFTAHGRERPDSDDYDDGNWLITRVEVTVSGFHADLDVSLRSDDFDELQQLLTRIVHHQSERETWEPMEPSLHFEIEHHGDVARVNGVATEPLGSRNSLRFSMPLSTASIETAVDQIEELLLIFPLPGRWPTT